MSVLGIDLSLTSTGVALIRRDGSVATESITSSKGTDSLTSRSNRLAHVTEAIASWLSEWRPTQTRTENVELALIESLFSSRSGAGLVERGWLWGKVVDKAISREVPIGEVSNSVVKKWATGGGRAEKLTMGVHMGRLFPDVLFGSDDEVDALAIAHIAACRLGYPVPRLARHGAEAWRAVKFPELAE